MNLKTKWRNLDLIQLATLSPCKILSIDMKIVTNIHIISHVHNANRCMYSQYITLLCIMLHTHKIFYILYKMINIMEVYIFMLCKIVYIKVYILLFPWWRE